MRLRPIRTPARPTEPKEGRPPLVRAAGGRDGPSQAALAGPFHFEQGGTQQPRLVAEDLDLNKVYRAKVHFGGKVVRSWDMDFRKMGVDMVYIWRAKGAWRMQPVSNGRCERPDHRR